MSSLDSRWPLGLEKNFGIMTGNYELFCKRVKPTISTKFMSVVHMFKLKLKSLENSNAIFLNIIDFEKLRDCIRDVFLDVINSYDDKNNLICQVNLSLADLKKKFIKSGLFHANDKKSITLIDFLVNELCVISNSDESLVIDDNFVVEIIVTKKTLNVNGMIDCTKCNINEKPIYSSKNCQKLFNKVGQLFKNEVKTVNIICFLKNIKLGFIDLSKIDKSKNNTNCVELSLAFSILCDTNNNNIYKCIKIYIIDFKCNSENFIKKILTKPITEKNISFHELINMYSKMLKRKIVIWSKENDDSANSTMNILFRKLLIYKFCAIIIKQ